MSPDYRRPTEPPTSTFPEPAPVPIVRLWRTRPLLRPPLRRSSGLLCVCGLADPPPQAPPWVVSSAASSTLVVLWAERRNPCILRYTGVPVRSLTAICGDQAAFWVWVSLPIHLRSLIRRWSARSGRRPSSVLARARGQQRGSGVPVRYSDCPRSGQAVVWVPARSAFSSASLPILM